MLFSTDAQTINDLGIFGNKGSSGVYELYNRTQTRGGAALLEELFRYPLSDAATINTRISIISHFGADKTAFPFERDSFDVIEQYLSDTDERSKLTGQAPGIGKNLGNLIAIDTKYKNIYKGVTALIKVIQELSIFVASDETNYEAYKKERLVIATLLSVDSFILILQEKRNGKLAYDAVSTYDIILRFRHREDIRKLLHYIYYLDVYIAVAHAASEQHYCYPQVLPQDGQHRLQVTGLYHPEISKPVANNIMIDSKKNVVFLTGANMAGKSTFLRSLGIAVYLAHCGFPVAAASMTFTLLDGMYTTINLPDNLGIGASHFYAEVLRVKKISQALSAGKSLFVLFDELFRGTNVKDANEATIAVVTGFAKNTDSLFMISTHIIEAGEVLQKKCEQIQYKYLPTRMELHQPIYSYKLESGITDDRHGMVLIRNEGILDMLEEGLSFKAI